MINHRHFIKWSRGTKMPDMNLSIAAETQKGVRSGLLVKYCKSKITIGWQA